MTRRLMELKPGVSRRTHVLCAALLWTGIGLFLTQRGIRYLIRDESLMLAVAAILAGSLKSRYILDKAAIRGIDRIRQFADNTCIGAVYSWKTWLLVVVMMLFGLLLRRSSIPEYVIGTILVAIGWALVWSSRLGWKAWFNWNSNGRSPTAQ